MRPSFFLQTAQETTAPSYLKQGAKLVHDWIESNIDLPHWLIVALELTILITLGWLLWRAARFVLIRLFSLIADRSTTRWDDMLIKHKFFKRLAQFIPGVVAWWIVPDLFSNNELTYRVLSTVVELYLILVGLFTLFSFLNATRAMLESKERLYDKPVRSYVQLIKVIVAVVAVIYIVSAIFAVSPTNILTGLGAVTAVVLLLFKDTILGLVASVQLSTIDLVRKGDWISMDKYGADGDVIEINLTSVKVQNWDKTITIIPTYALVSDSFKNWRGMQNSGGRRIKRSLKIKTTSVRFVEEKFVDQMNGLSLIKDFLAERRNEIREHNEKYGFDPLSIDARRMTNLGIFRAYATAYLKKHPKINQEMTCMVRQLEPTETGIPLEIYAFSEVKEWVEYEGIVSDIFDHLLAAIDSFELEIFQEPSGSDMRHMLGSPATKSEEVSSTSQSQEG